MGGEILAAIRWMRSVGVMTSLFMYPSITYLLHLATLNSHYHIHKGMVDNFLDIKFQVGNRQGFELYSIYKLLYNVYLLFTHHIVRIGASFKNWVVAVDRNAEKSYICQPLTNGWYLYN